METSLDPRGGKPIAGGRIRFLGSFPGQVPLCGLPEVAFAGRSNVGKSSAINRLLSCGKAARVSHTPGRTQAVNLFVIEDRLVFADLPGYGFAKVPAAVQEGWKALVEGYLSERDALRLVVVLLDPRRDPQQLDAELIGGLRAAQLPLLVIATKMDKLPRAQQAPALKALRGAYGLRPEELIPFSSAEGTGVESAWAAINRAVGARS